MNGTRKGAEWCAPRTLVFEAAGAFVFFGGGEVSWVTLPADTPSLRPSGDQERFHLQALLARGHR